METSCRIQVQNLCRNMWTNKLHKAATFPRMHQWKSEERRRQIISLHRTGGRHDTRRHR